MGGKRQVIRDDNWQVCGRSHKENSCWRQAVCLWVIGGEGFCCETRNLKNLKDDVLIPYNVIYIKVGVSFLPVAPLQNSSCKLQNASCKVNV